MFEALAVEQKLVQEINRIVEHMNKKFEIVSDELDKLKEENVVIRERLEKLESGGAVE